MEIDRLAPRKREEEMSEQTYEWIEYKIADGVATITFNAPQFNNALGLRVCRSFSTRSIGPRQTTPLARSWSPGGARPFVPGSI